MRAVLCSLFMVCVLAGCKNDDLYGINANTRTYILANKKWQNSAIYVHSPQGALVSDQFTFLPDYRKDDYFLFRADSTFELNDNVNRDPLSVNPVLATGRWVLQANEQVMRFNVSSGVLYGDSLRITSIDANGFVLERPVLEGTQFFAYRLIP